MSSLLINRPLSQPKSVIMRMTGHSSREMFDRYNRVDEDDMRGAFSRMRSFLESVDQKVDQSPSQTKRGLAKSSPTP